MPPTPKSARATIITKSTTLASIVRSSVPSTPIALGSYIFAGGFTVGVSQHFDVIAHLEESDYGVKTTKANFPSLPVHIGVSKWPIDELRANHGSEGRSLDLIFGNPPCAAWSVAGYTKSRGTDKWRTDPRVQCTVKHFGLLTSLKPKFWVWESVTQAFTKGREFVDELTKQAIELGYSVSFILHDCKWLGLPQTRKRFFMVCHNQQFAPITPAFVDPPLPQEVLEIARRGRPMIPVKSMSSPEVLARISSGERLVNYWKRAVADPDPDKWTKNAQGGIIGRPSYGHCRLPSDGPGGAVVGYGIIHPTEHRWLSTEEMQVLCGFPPEYKFTPGGTSARASEIARGVCPPVGEWLARSIVESLPLGRDDPFDPPHIPKVTLYDFRTPRIRPVDITSTYHTFTIA